MSLTPPDQEQLRLLIERIQSRSDYQRSCDDIDRLFRRRVRRFFGAHGFTSDESEELTQETFIRVFNAIDGLRIASRFPSWLFEIAANIYRNELRRRGAAKRDALEESIEELAASQAEGRADALVALRSPAPGPLDGTLRRERLAGLRAQLDQLPPQMRQCVFLRLYQDLKYREIADVMHISIETVKAHLHQAQKRLRMAIADRPEGQDPGVSYER